MLLHNRNNDHKTIVVSIDNYNRLKELGNVGDSFNDVLTVLLSQMKEKEDKEKEGEE